MYEDELSDDAITEDEDFMEVINNVLHPRAPQNFRERPNHINIWNDTEFKARFRLEKDVLMFITEHISDEISSTTDR